MKNKKLKNEFDGFNWYLHKYKKNIGYFNEIYHILLFYMVKSVKKIEIYLYSNLKR